MNCFKHRDLDALGICHACGRAVCERRLWGMAIVASGAGFITLWLTREHRDKPRLPTEDA